MNAAERAALPPPATGPGGGARAEGDDAAASIQPAVAQPAAEPTAPRGEPPRRPVRLTIRLECQHRPMTAVLPRPAAASAPEFDDADDFDDQIDLEAPATDAAPRDAASDSASADAGCEPRDLAPAAVEPSEAKDAPIAAQEGNTLRDALSPPPFAERAADTPAEPAPRSVDVPPPRSEAGRHADRRDDRPRRRARSRPGDMQEVDAVNQAIEDLPEIRSRRELILRVRGHLHDVLERGPMRCMLAGGTAAAAQALRAVLYTTLWSLSRVPGPRTLLLRTSPHHAPNDAATRVLARHAAVRGFAVTGHDPLGEADRDEPLYRADRREAAMRASIADALRGERLAVAVADSAEIAPLHQALATDHALACIALVTPLGRDEQLRAIRLQALMRVPGALVLRPGVLLESGAWCTPAFVEQVCTDAARALALALAG